MTNEASDWRDPMRAALKGPVADFDRYNPVDAHQYDALLKPGVLDLPLAAAIFEHTKQCTGVSIPQGAMTNLAQHVNAWLANVAMGAMCDSEYAGLMDAYQAQVRPAQPGDADAAPSDEEQQAARAAPVSALLGADEAPVSRFVTVAEAREMEDRADLYCALCEEMHWPHDDDTDCAMARMLS